MAVTEILADYGWTGLLSKQDNTYRHDVDAWFAPFQQHVAVKRFAELARAGYTFDGPATTMVCLSAPPELKLEGRAEVLKSGDYRARTGVGCRSEARPGISRVHARARRRYANNCCRLSPRIRRASAPLIPMSSSERVCDSNTS